MKKKIIIISIIASLIVAASIIIPVTIINSKKAKPINKEKEIVFTFSDLAYQGPRDEGGSYWELNKNNGSPTGEYDFGTRSEYIDEHWQYHSYVDGYDYDALNEHIVTIYKSDSSDTPVGTFHFEFALPSDAKFISSRVEGHFYNNYELTSEVTSIRYPINDKPLCIIESVNEYYQIVLDKIIFTYIDL